MRVEAGKVIIATKDRKATMEFDSIPNLIVNLDGVWHGWMGKGSNITGSLTTAEKSAVYSFNYTARGLEMKVDATYLTGVAVVNEGMQATVYGDMGFVKDKNVHAEGDTVVGGYIDDSTFGVYTDYGDYQADLIHDPIGNEILRDTQNRVENERRIAKLVIDNSYKPMRILCQPNGIEATYTFSNHADLSSREAIMAIMHGSSDPEHPYYGVKGLVSRGLKGMWSTFDITVGSAYGFDDPDYLNVLLGLYSAGLEFGPHTFKDGLELRSLAETEFPKYETNFNSRNWTDHGLSSGGRSIGLSSLGWDVTEGDYYIMDLLELYGYEYCWAYQDVSMGNKNQWHEDRFAFPYYLVYQNPALSMPTYGPMWQYKNASRAIRELVIGNRAHEDVIDEWIEQCGVVTDHDYLALSLRDGENYNSGTPYLITDKLDSIFAYMESKVASGELWNPTMSEFCDHFRKLRKVSIEDGNGQYIVTNTGDNVGGCSFLIGDAWVIPKVSGSPINYKHVTRGTICWMDLPNGDTTITF